MRRAADKAAVLLRMLFPPTCLGCGLLLRAHAPDDLPLCRRCALDHIPLPPWARHQDGIGALHGYGGPLLSALSKLKFHGQTAFAGPLGATLAASPLLHASWDAVVPVPLHPSRYRQRGYNQSALLARHAVRELPHAPHVRPRVRPRWLARIRATSPQHRLPAASRRDNVQGAFAVPRPADVAGRKILLVDDVTTTGATLAAARTALRHAGAATVGALALLRALA